MATEAEFRASALPFTLHREGGLSLDPKDPGNWTGGKVGVGKLLGTKYGIASASHPHLDVRHLTLAEAGDIYWREYVVAPRFDRLALPLLLVTFDAGVNCGPGRAAGWLRTAEVDRGLPAQIDRLTALNLAYHRGLKTWPRYGAGWSARIEACRKQALLLAAAAPVALPAAHPAPAPRAVRSAPQAAHQPPAGPLALLLRALLEALLHPQPKGLPT